MDAAGKRRRVAGGNSSKENVAANNSTGRSVEEIYQKKTQLEHILLRPDSYVGSIEAQTMDHWVVDDKTSRMTLRKLEYVPALYKIFDEILVNAADNLVRSPQQDQIRVDIKPSKGSISVWNNGPGLPVELHKEHGVYVPELVFGHLLTSDNYDDSEKKVTGGRNGYGAKLTNIFSTRFVLETQDSSRGKRYTQVWEKNMGVCKSPEVKAASGEDFTCVTFFPDLPRFGMSTLDADIVALMRRRAYDVAASTHGRCKVSLDGVELDTKNFEDYVSLHVPEEAFRVCEVVNERWEVAIGLTDGSGFRQVSFVNSINTSRGGTHVNYIGDQVVNAVLERLSKQKSSGPLAVKAQNIRSYLWVFVNCLIENPAFDSQTKETLTSKKDRFGSTCELPQAMIDSILESGLLDTLQEWSKQMGQSELAQYLNRSDCGLQKRLWGIPKLDDANLAGTKSGSECTLILTEGDSAKALAVAGLSVVGRDRYGVFPLRGKLRNVRDLTVKQMLENKEIDQLLRIMALDASKEYVDTKGLRYGSIMIMTDQDFDGSHIKGLIINFVERWFPSLLKMPGFLQEFVTPIVKVTKGDEVQTFYTIPEYEQWREQNNDGKGWTCKYYKGLGTSTSNEAKEYFADLEKSTLRFTHSGTPEDNQLIDMAFNGKRADERKQWISGAEAGVCVDHSQDELSYADFINKELVLFAKYDVERAIPSMVDGLKVGQRKILFGALKKNITSDIKVAQLSGYVAEHSAYHHGEAALQGTIVSMAQTFVGSNNVNLLVPSGQFGTRLQGGKDHAAARYIFTRLSKATRCIFPEDDDAVLEKQTEEGVQIEPKWYCPILPMVLVNGADGIGTGWSTSVPNFNPRDVIRSIRKSLRKEPTEPLVPWYRGFSGTLVPSPGNAGKYDVWGKAVKRGRSRLEITELPVRRWTEDYKEWLLDQLPQPGAEKRGTITEVREHHTENTVHFVLSMTPDKLAEAERRGIERVFHLKSHLSTTNMYLFDTDGKLKKYSTAEDIIQDFIPVRLGIYAKRKEYMLQKMARELAVIANRLKFVRLVVDGDLEVDGRKTSMLCAQMRQHGLQTMGEINGEPGTITPEADLPGPQGFRYLLSMKMWSLTEDKLEALTKLHAEKTQKMEDLRATTLETLWETDLVRLEEALDAIDKEDAREAELAAKMAAKARGEDNSLVNQQCVLVLSRNFTAKRVRTSEWKARARGKKMDSRSLVSSKSKKEAAAAEDEEQEGGANSVDAGLSGVFCCYDWDALLVFSEDGLAFMLQALDVPLAKRMSAPSAPFSEFLPELGEKTKIASLITVPHGALKDQTDEFVVLITTDGMAKKVNLAKFRSLRPGKSILAMKVAPGDKLGWAHRASANCALVLATRQGNLLRTPLGANWTAASLKSCGKKAVKMRKGGIDAIASTSIHTMSAQEIRSVPEAKARVHWRHRADSGAADGDAAMKDATGGEKGDDEEDEDEKENQMEEEEDAGEEDGGESDADEEKAEAAGEAGAAEGEAEADGEGEAATQAPADESGAGSDGRCLLLITETGMGLRTPLDGPRAKLGRRGGVGKRIIKLASGDHVVSVSVVSNENQDSKPMPAKDAFRTWYAEQKEEAVDDAAAEEEPPASQAPAASQTEEGGASKRGGFDKVHKARERFKALPMDVQQVYFDRAEEDARRYAREMEAYGQNQQEELLVGSLGGCVSRVTVGSIPVVSKVSRGKAVAKCKGSDRVCAASLLSSMDVDKEERAATATSSSSQAKPAQLQQPTPAASLTTAAAEASATTTAGASAAAPAAAEVTGTSAAAASSAAVAFAAGSASSSTAPAPSTPPRQPMASAQGFAGLCKSAGLPDNVMPPLSLTPPGADRGSARRTPGRSLGSNPGAGGAGTPRLRLGKGARLSHLCRSPKGRHSAVPTPSRNRSAGLGGAAGASARAVLQRILKPKFRVLSVSGSSEGATAPPEPTLMVVENWDCP